MNISNFLCKQNITFTVSHVGNIQPKRAWINQTSILTLQSGGHGRVAQTALGLAKQTMLRSTSDREKNNT